MRIRHKYEKGPVREAVLRGLLGAQHDKALAACALPCAFYLSANPTMLRTLSTAAARLTPVLVQCCGQWLHTAGVGQLLTPHDEAHGKQRRSSRSCSHGRSRSRSSRRSSRSTATESTTQPSWPSWQSPRSVAACSRQAGPAVPHVTVPEYFGDAEHSAQMARCAATILKNIRASKRRRHASISMLRDRSHESQSARNRLAVWLSWSSWGGRGRGRDKARRSQSQHCVVI